jgi:hypothetical protein
MTFLLLMPIDKQCKRAVSMIDTRNNKKPPSQLRITKVVCDILAVTETKVELMWPATYANIYDGIVEMKFK